MPPLLMHTVKFMRAVTSISERQRERPDHCSDRGHRGYTFIGISSVLGASAASTNLLTPWGTGPTITSSKIYPKEETRLI
jgi:hypothetical protein